MTDQGLHFAQARIRTRAATDWPGNPSPKYETRDGVKIVLKSGSWVLLRPSGTEPLIRTYAESGGDKQTQSLLDWAAKAVRA